LRDVLHDINQNAEQYVQAKVTNAVLESGDSEHILHDACGVCGLMGMLAFVCMLQVLLHQDKIPR
jgi:hypothetical protein